jgi:hypothetical protein
MFQTTDLIQPLREHGVQLSREQVFRLVTRTPELRVRRFHSTGLF